MRTKVYAIAGLILSAISLVLAIVQASLAIKDPTILIRTLFVGQVVMELSFLALLIYLDEKLNKGDN